MLKKKKGYIIAIDGPAGAGKSTISKEIARRLNYLYVDTGAMFRAIAWKALQRKISLESSAQLTHMVRKTKLRFVHEDNNQEIYIDDEKITSAIRSQKVSQATSQLATHPKIRQLLRLRQRQYGKKGGVVMEGRDIGTVVFPHADIKFFLDASPLERARRRFKEIRKKNKKATLSSIAKSIQERDEKDRHRKNSPLRVADDAVVIDTTGISQLRVCQIILNFIQKKNLIT